MRIGVVMVMMTGIEIKIRVATCVIIRISAITRKANIRTTTTIIETAGTNENMKHKNESRHRNEHYHNR